MSTDSEVGHPSFYVRDRFDQVVLLRLLRSSREQMVIRLLAIEDQIQKNHKIERRGELINIQTELDSIDRFIQDLWQCVGRIY